MFFCYFPEWVIFRKCQFFLKITSFLPVQSPWHLTPRKKPWMKMVSQKPKSQFLSLPFTSSDVGNDQQINPPKLSPEKERKLLSERTLVGNNFGRDFRLKSWEMTIIEISEMSGLPENRGFYISRGKTMGSKRSCLLVIVIYIPLKKFSFEKSIFSAKIKIELLKGNYYLLENRQC